MCGLTGFWDLKASFKENEGLDLAKKMADQIQSRGPDSFGAWMDPKVGILFAHRRLSIQDLSPEGHQPMHSASKRFTAAYNGEIYNGPDLQKELVQKGYAFRGHSDTEVMLAAFEEWGIVDATKKFIGMFAIVLWDHLEQKVTLIRDRLGIKPLYWGWQGDVLFFGSQPKSFYPHPAWKSVINQQALTTFFRFSYVPSPLSIYENIQKLQPGTILEIFKDKSLKQTAFWSLEDVRDQGKQNQFMGSFRDATDALETLLKDAINKRMLADVPLGAFLSGGIDSSTVVALMQAQSSKKIKTFSIGFQEDQYNEATYAREVAGHLGTDHHELYVTSKEAQSVIPQLSEWYDEPFADSSQIPTYLVSKLARQFVTVSLSGDGGDELFAGYTRYFIGDRFWRLSQKVPELLKGFGAKGLGLFPSTFWNTLQSIAPKRLPTHLGDKILKAQELLKARSLEDYYKTLVSQWMNPRDIVKGGEEFFAPHWDALQNQELPSIEIMQYLDTLTYLPDDILAKVDRASMAVGLEARVPLIDHRVVEFSWQLPLSMKVHQGKGKRILREVLKRYVPEHLFERPKMGFGVPIGDWIKGDLRDWAESLLSKEALESSGLIESAPILEKWGEHLSGKQNWQYALWPVLMFQSWVSKPHF
jgi:asparagine synthase (glutamine-hydrolysing)